MNGSVYVKLWKSLYPSSKEAIEYASLISGVPVDYLLCTSSHFDKMYYVIENWQSIAEKKEAQDD